MKKLLLIMILMVSVFFVSCDEFAGDDYYYFGDYIVYHEQEGTCEPFYMDLIYMDMENNYYLTSSGCTMTDYYIIQNDEEIDVETAMIQGLFDIDDVLASNAPFLMVQEFVNDEPILASETIIGVINGYTIMRSEIFCEAVVGRIIVDGYDFGFVSSGCSADLNSIGYYAVKDDMNYDLKGLVETEELTTQAIFSFYRRDEGRHGSYTTQEELT